MDQEHDLARLMLVSDVEALSTQAFLEHKFTGSLDRLFRGQQGAAPLTPAQRELVVQALRLVFDPESQCRW